MNFLRRYHGFAAIFLALFLTFGLAGSAAAATETSTTVSSSSIQTAQLPLAGVSPDAIDRASPNVCGTKGNEAASNWLPINRWGDASTSFHTRQSSGFWNKIGNLNIRGTMLGMGMSIGNALTNVSTDLASFSLNFCVLNQMGGAADKISATVGNVLMETGVIIALVVASIVTVVLRAARGGGSMVSGLGSKALILGMLAVMLAGASQSTGGGIDGSTATFKPGMGSPGWIAVKVNDTLSELASVGNYGVLQSGIAADSAEAAGTEEVGTARSCTAYRNQLRTAYTQTYGGGTNKIRASIPLMMSATWESTGLQAWRVAQVGTSEAGENVYCRILENTAGIPSTTQLKYIQGGNQTISGIDVRLKNGDSTIQSGSLAVQPFDGDQEDRSYVGWAACTGGAPDPSWSRDGNASSQDCTRWATENDFGGDLFNWGDGDTDVKKKLSASADDDKRDFLLALHGSGSNQAMTSVLIYSISSLCMLIVFGGMSVAIILSKIAALVMIMGGVAVLVASLAPSASAARSTQYFKSFLGITLLGFAAQFIFGLLVVVAGILVQLGKATMPGGPFGPMNMLWSGLSPLLAVFIMHYLFKNVVKVPSPFKISSGMAWAGAGAGVGAAAMSRADGVQSALGRGNFRGAARAAVGGAGGGGGKGKPVSAPGGMKAPKTGEIDPKTGKPVTTPGDSPAPGRHTAGKAPGSTAGSTSTPTGKAGRLSPGAKLGQAGQSFKARPLTTSAKAGAAVLGAGAVLSGAAPLAGGIYAGWKGTQAVRRYANGTSRVAESQGNSQRLVERNRRQQSSQQQDSQSQSRPHGPRQRNRGGQPRVTHNEQASRLNTRSRPNSRNQRGGN